MNTNRFISNSEWEKEIPLPVDMEHPEYAEFYRIAWKLAADHVIDLPGMPQTPYMDEGFCDTDVWIWDTCFMTLFCKYAPRAFPGVETLNNFYELLYGVKNFPVIITKNAPSWTGEVIGKPAQVQLHIADNPPLFAWAELQYARVTGDLDHVRDLLRKQYLQKHFFWVESLREPVKLQGVRNPTCAVRRELGYFWEGGRSGMDNTPRGRVGEHAEGNRPNNPDMLWIDLISQQCLAAECIAQLYALVNDSSEESEWMNRSKSMKELIDAYYWDSRDGFYYDLNEKTQTLMRVMTPASFWAALAGVPSAEKMSEMVKKLNDPEKFGGSVPWVSLARDDPDFDAETGSYWRGSLWLPTAYMGLRSLIRYGYFEQAAHDGALIMKRMYRTWKNYFPHTIWECYAPNLDEPARSCDESHRIVRPDFCGWSALGPISVYLETVIGLYDANAFTNDLYWHISPNRRGVLGVRNYHFGEIRTDLICDPSSGELAVTSDRSYHLHVNGKLFEVFSGRNSFNL